MTLVILTSFLAISLLPGGMATPTGIRVRSDAEGSCVSKCRQHWGWPGHPFSNDPWGSVVNPKLNPGSDQGVKGVAAAPSSSSEAHTTSSYTQSSSYYAPAYSSSSAYSAPTSSESSSSTHKSSSSKSSSSSTFSSSSSSKPPPPPSSTSKPPPPPPSSKPPPPPSSSPEPKPSPPPSGGSGSGSTSGPTSESDIQAYLAGHNDVRAQHGAAPLSYSQDLASKAQQWANGCQFHHSGGSLGPFGENIAAGTADSYGIADALKSWTDEAKDYNPGNPQASHFTQVVWKATSQVGCALQMCDGIFDASFGKAKYYVCEYSKQGNVVGSFAQNVQA